MAITAEKVNDLITDKGIQVIFHTYASDTFDPLTNTRTRGAKTEHTVYAIPPYENAEGWEEGNFIESGEGQIGISNYGLSFTPWKGQEVQIFGILWIVTSVRPISNNSGVVLYLMTVESGMAAES